MNSARNPRSSNDRSNSQERARERVAIVYQVLHHFREPVFRELVQPRPGAPEYQLFGAATNTLDSNRTIDPARAAIPVSEGGLPWTFIRNVSLGGPFLWQSGILRAALARDTDVVIFLGNMYYVSTWFGAILARLRSKRVLFWGHGYTRRESGVQGWIRERFYCLGHGVLLYGNRARTLFLERGFSKDDLYVVYNSLDFERQCEVRAATTEQDLVSLRERLIEHPNLPLVVCIGRVEPRKKLEDLIDATKALEESGLRINLLIVGDGSAKADLEKRSQALDLEDRVHFYGECYDESEVGPLLMASSLCVCPRALGLTAIHAMAYGLPVLSHDDFDQQGPEVEAIVPGETGDLYELNDSSDMARKIQAWIRDHPSKSEVSTRCIAEIRNRFNAERQVRIIDQAVKDIPAGALELNREKAIEG